MPLLLVELVFLNSAGGVSVSDYDDIQKPYMGSDQTVQACHSPRLLRLKQALLSYQISSLLTSSSIQLGSVMMVDHITTLQ